MSTPRGPERVGGSRPLLTLRILVFAGLLAAAAAAAVHPLETPAARWTAADPPAAAGSSVPVLSVDPQGRAALLWFERLDGGRARLVLARGSGVGWSAPVTVTEGSTLAVNAMSTPALLAGADSALVVCWPERVAGGEEASRLMVACSRDGGRRWSTPVVAHRDGLPVEHGFAAVAAEAGGARLAWLDARQARRPDGTFAEEGQFEMTLRSAHVTLDGAVGADSLVDARTCDCCPVAAAQTSRGVLLAFRDRDAAELRDITVMRRSAGGWAPVADAPHDGWKLAGCPVNGPSLAADGDRVAMAWFTGAGDSARVQLARSRDAGAHFAAAGRVDAGHPVGRGEVVELGGDRVAVAWFEQRPPGAALLVRTLEPGGAAGVADTVALLPALRGAGRARLARTHDGLIVAWTEAGPAGRVHAAFHPLP